MASGTIEQPLPSESSVEQNLPMSASFSRLYRYGRWISGSLRRLPIRGLDAQPAEEFVEDKYDDEWSLRTHFPGPAMGAFIGAGIPACLVFAFWMSRTVHQADHSDDSVVWRMWLAGSWTLFAPLLIVLWEKGRLGALMTLEKSKNDGWDVPTIAAGVVTQDRIRKWIGPMAGVAVGLGYLLSQSTFENVLGVVNQTPVDLVLGFVSTLWLGVTFGIGICGVISMLVNVWQALDIPNEGQLKWNAFTSRQIPGIEALGGYTYMTGALFSAGVVFLPGVYLIMGDLPIVPRVLGWVLCIVLVLGGLVSFLLPTYWIEKTVRAQQDHHIDELAPAMNGLQKELLDYKSTTVNPDLAESLIQLRREVVEAKSVPWVQQVTFKSLSLVVVPLTIAVVSGVL